MQGCHRKVAEGSFLPCVLAELGGIGLSQKSTHTVIRSIDHHYPANAAETLFLGCRDWGDFVSQQGGFAREAAKFLTLRVRLLLDS